MDYDTDPCFGEIWTMLQQPTIINKTPFLDYTICEGRLYKMHQLCVPQSKDLLIITREAHSSSCRGHFGAEMIRIYAGTQQNEQITMNTKMQWK
jgi:hypothetical protein